MSNLIVKLERAGKVTYIILNTDDYEASVKFDRGNNPKMYWGSGSMWYIKDVQFAHAQ